MKHVKDMTDYWCEDTVTGKYTGKNVGIAVLDTGIVPHPDLKDRIKGFKDCVGGRGRMYDDNGHGTHVTGILGGDGRMSRGVHAGMAPDADLYSIKVLDARGQGTVDGILRGMQWLLENWYAYGIRIVNMSVGANLELEDEKGKELEQAAEALWDAGLVVVASAGNYGPGEGTVSVPGTSRKIITVGSSDIIVSAGGKHTSFYSGCGPTHECVVKPDVVAPGNQIISCNSRFGIRRQRPYTVKSGSSMATPVVSGAIALLLSKYGDMSNVEVKLKLRESCERMEEKQGWGSVRISKLLVSRRLE